MKPDVGRVLIQSLGVLGHDALKIDVLQGLDSLEQIELVNEMAEHLGVEITAEDELPDFTYDNLVAYFEARCA